MDEILRNLRAESRVLDLGCSFGSFSAEVTQAMVVRVDRCAPAKGDEQAFFVQADAAHLPFRDASFAAIVSNHSLEHFVRYTDALVKIGRVVEPNGSLFVAVPDASTFTDKLYRWLARGGGHVNAFTSAESLARSIAELTRLPHVATRTLCSSLAFLNRTKAPRPLPRRLMLVGGGYPSTLFLYNWLSRHLDRLLSTRVSVYGWAFYFGGTEEPISTTTWRNVCPGCGSAVPAVRLLTSRNSCGLRTWHCSQCNAVNPYAED